VEIPIRLMLYTIYIAPIVAPPQPLPTALKAIARGFLVVWCQSAIYRHLNLLPSPLLFYSPGLFSLLIFNLMFKGTPQYMPSVGVLYFGPFNPFHCPPSPFTSHPSFQQLSVHTLISSTFTDVMFHDITDALSFSFPFPLSPSSIEQFHRLRHVPHLTLWMIMLVFVYMFVYLRTCLPCTRENMRPLCVWAWLTSLSMRSSACIALLLSLVGERAVTEPPPQPSWVLDSFLFPNLYATVYFYCYYFWWDWGLNSGLCTYKAGTLFWSRGLLNCLPGLSSNCDPPDLSLPSSWDYRHEPGSCTLEAQRVHTRTHTQLFHSFCFCFMFVCSVRHRWSVLSTIVSAVSLIFFIFNFFKSLTFFLLWNIFIVENLKKLKIKQVPILCEVMKLLLSWCWCIALFNCIFFSSWGWGVHAEYL
jgi:hypothetical protein